MTLLPQANAQLLSITRGGSSEDYDRPAGGASPTWQGAADAYIQDRIRTTFNQQGALERVVETTLFVAGDLPVQLQSGDTVVYSAGNQQPPAVFTGRIQNIVSPAWLPALPDYYKCALEGINAV